MSKDVPQSAFEAEFCKSSEKIEPQTLMEPSINTARSTNLASTQLDSIVRELNELSASFFQTWSLRTKFSSDNVKKKSSVTGNSTEEDMPALPSHASSEFLSNPSIEIHDFLKDSSSTSTTSSRFKFFMKSDEDDGMSIELNRLDASQENLRKELDLATCGFGLLSSHGPPQDLTLPLWRRLCCCRQKKR
jgi:hypothetical protein